MAVITLADPRRRNAQTPALWRELAEIGAGILGTPDVRVVLLRAEGPSFSAGLDRGELAKLPALAAMPDDELDGLIAGYQQAFTWWRDPRIVSIAAVQGHAVGAGFQLALACDLRVVADDVAFAMRETTLGLVPDLGGTKPLVDTVGYARALEICLSGRWVGAREAVEIGLAVVAVPSDELDQTARDLAAALLAAPAGAVSATKALLQGAAGRSADDQRAAERTAQRGRLRDLAGGD